MTERSGPAASALTHGRRHVIDRGASKRASGWIGRLAIAATVLLSSSVAVPPRSALADAPGDPTAGIVACRYAPTHRVAQVRDGAIREASGLVASQQFPGIYWTLNDSGN